MDGARLEVWRDGAKMGRGKRYVRNCAGAGPVCSWRLWRAWYGASMMRGKDGPDPTRPGGNFHETARGAAEASSPLLSNIAYHDDDEPTNMTSTRPPLQCISLARWRRVRGTGMAYTTEARHGLMARAGQWSCQARVRRDSGGGGGVRDVWEGVHRHKKSGTLRDVHIQSLISIHSSTTCSFLPHATDRPILHHCTTPRSQDSTPDASAAQA